MICYLSAKLRVGGTFEWNGIESYFDAATILLDTGHTDLVAVFDESDDVAVLEETAALYFLFYSFDDLGVFGDQMHLCSTDDDLGDKVLN